MPRRPVPKTRRKLTQRQIRRQVERIRTDIEQAFDDIQLVRTEIAIIGSAWDLTNGQLRFRLKRISERRLIRLERHHAALLRSLARLLQQLD